jgi:hypothetical protein
MRTWLTAVALALAIATVMALGLDQFDLEAFEIQLTER